MHWQNEMRKANAAYSSGQFEKAIGLYSEVIKSDSQNIPALYQRGLSYVSSDDLKSARKDFIMVLKLTSDSVLKRDVYYNLGLVYERLREDNVAVEWYKKALNVDQMFYKAMCNLSAALMRLSEKELNPDDCNEKMEQSLKYLNRALGIEPKDALSYWNRAILHYNLGNTDKMKDDFSAFIKLTQPDDPNIKIAQIALSGEKDQSALLHHERIRELKRMIQKIIKTNNEGSFEKALRLCDSAFDISLDSVLEEVLWDERSHALFGLGRIKDALECCEKGIRVNPESARIHYTKGTILAHWGRKREALASYKRYVELAPPQYAQVVKSAKQIIHQLEQGLIDNKIETGARPSLKYPDHYNKTARMAPGDKFDMALVHTAVAGPFVTLVYRWVGDLYHAVADRLDSRARAYIACAIYDAAIAAGIACEHGPPHGNRPSWLLAGASVPVALVKAGFDVSARTCFMNIGPCIVTSAYSQFPGGQPNKLISGFRSHFKIIKV